MASIGHGHPHPPPNYVNPPTRPPWVQATCVIYLSLVGGAILLRLYSRLRFGHRLWLDDAFAAFASAFAMSAYSLDLVMEQHYGYNRHTWDIPPAMYRTVVRLDWIYNELFVQASCQAKTSLLLFCWRFVGRGNSRAYYLLLIGLLVVVILCEITYVIVSVLVCIPLKTVWDPHPDYHHVCLHVPYFLLSAGLINTSTDVACLLFPILFVLRQQMPLRLRFAVASVFLVGFSANIASCLRIYFAFHQEMTGDIWNEMQPTIASNSEIGLGLICVNAPVIRPLLTHLLTYRARYNNIYAANTVNGPYGGAYRLGHTNGDLNYASETRNIKNNGTNGSKPVIVVSADRCILDYETDLEAAAANAESWQAKMAGIEPVYDARRHHDVSSNVGGLAGDNPLWESTAGPSAKPSQQ